MDYASRGEVMKVTLTIESQDYNVKKNELAYEKQIKLAIADWIKNNPVGYDHLQAIQDLLQVQVVWEK
jgi:hypothetical protein